MSVKPDKPIWIANMHNTVYWENTLPPELVKDIRYSLPSTFIGDCEFVGRTGGLYDFLSARNRSDDLLALRIWHAVSLPFNTPLLEVKKWLEDNVRPSERVSLVDYTLLNSVAEVDEFFEEASKRFEGIVVKPNLGYKATWWKKKKLHPADVVILAIKKTEQWTKKRIPSTFLVGGFDSISKTFKRIGDVSSGLTTGTKEGIGKVLSQTPRGQDKDYLYVPPTAVLEILYKSREKKGLRESQMLRVRFDKSPETCPLL